MTGIATKMSELDWEELRSERGGPTPKHMRRAAKALNKLASAAYGDVLRFMADLCDELETVESGETSPADAYDQGYLAGRADALTKVIEQARGKQKRTEFGSVIFVSELYDIFRNIESQPKRT